MAVPIRSYSIIVRNKTIDEEFPGGMTAYASLCPNQTLCTDGKLTRISFMTKGDMELFCAALAERGLTAADDKGVSQDVALLMDGEVNDYPYPFLEHGTIQGQHAAWLKGTDPGELVVADAERRSSGMRRISETELQSFDLVGTENNVEAYRDRHTGEMLYVGRTSPGAPHTLQGMTSAQVTEVKRVFEQATRLAEDEIPLHHRQDVPKPHWWTRRKLRRALSLFARVLQLQPEHWHAMWWAGMIHKRFGDYSTALGWFERASRVNPYEPEIAREACKCALELGRYDAAISLAVSAVKVSPEDAGLRSNLALALFLGGRATEAKAEIERAIAQDPSDEICRRVGCTIELFLSSKEKPPNTLRALQNWMRKAG